MLHLIKQWVFLDLIAAKETNLWHCVYYSCVMPQYSSEKKLHVNIFRTKFQDVIWSVYCFPPKNTWNSRNSTCVETLRNIKVKQCHTYLILIFTHTSRIGIC